MSPAFLTPLWLSWLHVTKPHVGTWCSSRDGMYVKDSLGMGLRLPAGGTRTFLVIAPPLLATVVLSWASWMQYGVCTWGA